MAVYNMKYSRITGVNESIRLNTLIKVIAMIIH